VAGKSAQRPSVVRLCESGAGLRIVRKWKTM